MSRFTFTREFYIPKGAAKVADKLSDAVAYLYTTKDSHPCAILFIGRQNKPLWRCRFRDSARRENAVADAFTNRRAALAHKSETAAKRKAWVPTYKVGDIFRTCWGYEQTNVEYFEIVEIHGKHAILREIGQETVETGWLRGKCVPFPRSYLKSRYAGDTRGTPIRRLMQEHGIKIDDVRTAWLVKPTRVAGVATYDANSWTAYH